MRGPAAWADKKPEANSSGWHHLPLIGTSVERRLNKLKRIRTDNHLFPTDYHFLLLLLFAWPKSSKKSRLPKNGWKQASILAGRNEGCYILPLLKTDVQKSPVHLQPSSQTFLLYFMLPVFLTPFLKGRSCWNYYTDIVKNLPLPVSQIEMEANNSQWNLFFSL